MAEGRITFLGTGTAFQHDGRGSQAVLVHPPRGTPFLVDAGPTVMAAATRYRADCASVDRLFLTHLHGDHTAGWPFLFLHFVFAHRRTRPFDVWGPQGTRRVLEGLVDLCYAEIVARAQFEVRYHELPVQEAEGIDAGEGTRLDTLPMTHHPSSIGLRFRLARRAGETAISVSGDTAWCPALVRLASGTELAVVECTSSDRAIEGHVSLADVRGHAAELDTRRLVLVHLTDEVAEALALDPIPRVLAAHDGLELPIAE